MLKLKAYSIVAGAVLAAGITLTLIYIDLAVLSNDSWHTDTFISGVKEKITRIFNYEVYLSRFAHPLAFSKLKGWLKTTGRSLTLLMVYSVALDRSRQVLLYWQGLLSHSLMS